MLLNKNKAKRSTWLNVGVSYYKQLKNKLKVLVRKAKISYLNQLLLKSKRDPRSSAELWLGINNILGRYNLRRNPVDTNLSLNDINRFFCSVAVTSEHCPAACFNATEFVDLLANIFSISYDTRACCFVITQLFRF